MFRSDWKNTFKKITELLEVKPNLRGLPYWVAAAIVGLLAVIYSLLFSRAIDTAQWLALNHPEYLFIISPVCFMAASWVVRRFAPPAGGTGVPQVICALNLNEVTQAREIDDNLNLRVALVIFVSSLLCVLGAGGLGREGPMVQMAACIFYFVGKQFHKVWPYEEHRSWIVAGGRPGSRRHSMPHWPALFSCSRNWRKLTFTALKIT